MKKYSKAYAMVSREILYRSIYFFFCFILCLIFSWVYEKELLFLYLDPLLQLNQNVMYTSLSDAFSTSLRLCSQVSFSCCLPHALYSLFCFLLPGFFPYEKKKFYKVAFWVILLYFTSFVVCRFYIIPELCAWFLKFGVSTQALYLSLQACVSNYVYWSGNVYLLCLCFLEIPVGFWMLLQFTWKETPVSLILSKNRKYASLSLLLLCATVSPPDVYMQITMFLFSSIIYESVLWYSFLNQALNQQRKKKTTFQSHG